MDKVSNQLLVAATWLGAICATAAHASEAGAPAPTLRMPDPLLSLREMYPDLAPPATGQHFTREFQPRSPASPAPAAIDTTRHGDLRLTSPWQRVGEFRSGNSIRLLTIWETTLGTIAVHEGKHGGTSLQWTSHTLGRSAAARGLFDQMVGAVHVPRSR